MQQTPHRVLQQYIPLKKLKWFTQDELKQLQYGAIKIDTVFILAQVNYNNRLFEAFDQWLQGITTFNKKGTYTKTDVLDWFNTINTYTGIELYAKIESLLNPLTNSESTIDECIDTIGSNITSQN
jgi:hypothetical protein